MTVYTPLGLCPGYPVISPRRPWATVQVRPQVEAGRPLQAASITLSMRAPLIREEERSSPTPNI